MDFTIKYSFREVLPLSLITVLLILIHVGTQHTIHAYGHGAPGRICGKMEPGHGEASLLSDLPFKITASTRFIKGGGKITIKVESTNPSRYTLAGVLFVMKKPGDKFKAFGRFDPDPSKEHLKAIDCFDKEGTQSGITHSHPNPKSMLVFQWYAPNDTSADYELHATLVRDFNSYWVDYVYPQTIKVRKDAPAAPAAPASAERKRPKSPFMSLAAVILLSFVI